MGLHQQEKLAIKYLHHSKPYVSDNNGSFAVSNYKED